MTHVDAFYNPLAPGYIADPFPHLAEMRELRPVQQTLAGPWAVFRHADVVALLRNPALSVDDANADFENSDRARLFDEIVAETGVDPKPSTSILNVDPPDHTRLRRLVSKAFTPRTIERLRPWIQSQVDRTLDAMAEAGRVDVVGELAFPLPFDVISEMLGMPESDKDQIREWSEALVKTIDPIITEDEVRAAVRAQIAMDDHIDQVIAWKRANPGDDLLTAMIEAEEDGDRMSAVELRDQVSLLFVAGHETTVNLIGTGLYELLRHPDQLERWRTDESMASSAVDELLRYVSPVQFTRRIATSDITFGQSEIPKGAFVLACLASANRDPEAWGSTADDLDLGRGSSAQLMSFGSGAHYCLGAALAKLEGEVAMGSFIRRFPGAEVTADPEWNGRINLRGLSKLVVDVAP